MAHRRARRLLVTGGSGFLGRHVVNGPAAEPWELIAPSSGAVDLRHADSVRTAVSDWKPAAIVHAAYRRGDRASIVDATRHVARAAERVRARLVHVSSDAVFGGRHAPYVEEDEPTPVHDYGRDKADAERAVLETCSNAVVVRTSLIVGRHDPSPHERLVRDAVSGRSTVRFFTDEIRCPVLVDDLAAALTELADDERVQGVLHLGGPDELSRSELATLTARRNGWSVTKLRFSSIAASGMARPSRVVLDSSRARSYGYAVRGPLDWE